MYALTSNHNLSNFIFLINQVLYVQLNKSIKSSAISNLGITDLLFCLYYFYSLTAIEAAKCFKFGNGLDESAIC